MQKELQILKQAVDQWQAQKHTASQVLSADVLEQRIDVSLGETPADASDIEQALTDYLTYTPNSAHPEYLKLLYSGVNKTALLGDWVTSLSNTTMHTYQVGPVATLMELELISHWNKLVGYNHGEQAGDGVMVSGGSQANLVGMMLARHKICPAFKAQGYQAMQGKRLIAYTSDQAHYSNQRSVNVLGIGAENLRSVKSDSAGRIDPDALAEAIEQDLAVGHQPFYIGLTAGTTVIGAFDPVKQCSDIARKHNIWLHIDGAWGGPVLFSKKHQHLLQDAHLSDSFAWDAHKLMNVPITAAVVLVKQAGLLEECTAGGGGDYLFHNDVNADYNLGERSIQCGRRADALKVWLSWKAEGNQGFANKIDSLIALKDRTLELIEQQESLQLLAPANYLNVLFRFTHTGLSDEKLNDINTQICKRMVKEGGAYIDHARYNGRVGVRLIIANPETNAGHIERLLEKCSAIGAELALH